MNNKEKGIDMSESEIRDNIVKNRFKQPDRRHTCAAAIEFPVPNSGTAQN